MCPVQQCSPPLRCVICCDLVQPTSLLVCLFARVVVQLCGLCGCVFVCLCGCVVVWLITVGWLGLLVGNRWLVGWLVGWCRSNRILLGLLYYKDVFSSSLTATISTAFDAGDDALGTAPSPASTCPPFPFICSSTVGS